MFPQILKPLGFLGTQMLTALPPEEIKRGPRSGSGWGHPTGVKPHPSSRSCEQRDVSSFCTPTRCFQLLTLLSLTHTVPSRPSSGGGGVAGGHCEGRAEKGCMLSSQTLLRRAFLSSRHGDCITCHWMGDLAGGQPLLEAVISQQVSCSLPS